MRAGAQGRGHDERHEKGKTPQWNATTDSATEVLGADVFRTT